MDFREAAFAIPTATAGAVALLLVAWCAPAVASSGVTAECEESRTVPPSEQVDDLVPVLATHNQSALRDILDDESVQTPALTDTSTDAAADDLDKEDSIEEAALSSDNPASGARLPGVPKAILPSFRQQMLRTDI